LDAGEAAAELRPNGLALSTDKDETGQKQGPLQVFLTWDEDGFQLGVLRHLPSIRRLTFIPQRNSPLVGSWENLQYVPGLFEFEMPGRHDWKIKLDAEAIRQLSRMPHLQRLVAALPADLSPKDFAPLGQIPRLAVLDLWCGTLGAEHLRALGRLERLVSLRIFTTRGSVDDDEALQHLVALKQLSELRLDGIGDAGLAHAGQIKSLTKLTLSIPSGLKTATRLAADEGLRHLEDLPALQILDIRGTGVTRDGLSGFAARHPWVHVRTDR
jgi:hypothetical protein